MAILSGDGIVAGLPVGTSFFFFKAAATAKAIGTPHALGLSSAGLPAVFAAGSPGLSGATIDGTSSTLGGNIPFTNPGSGNSYLAKMSLASSSGIIGVGAFDMLWYNSGISITTTTGQTINSVTLPSRDNAGGTNGVGVMAWLYCATATTNAGAVANTTITYTNSAGTGSRTGSLVQSWPATAVAGTFIPFTLQAGDLGVKSIQTLTLGTSYVTGTVILFLTRDIAFISLAAAASGQVMDWAQLGFPQLYNGTAMSFYVMPSATALGIIIGDIAIAQG